MSKGCTCNYIYLGEMLQSGDDQNLPSKSSPSSYKRPEPVLMIQDVELPNSGAARGGRFQDGNELFQRKMQIISLESLYLMYSYLYRIKITIA